MKAKASKKTASKEANEKAALDKDEPSAAVKRVRRKSVRKTAKRLTKKLTKKK